MGRPKKEPIHEELSKNPNILGDQPVEAVPEHQDEQAILQNVVDTKILDPEPAPAPKAAEAGLFPVDKYFLIVEDEVDISDDPRYPNYQIIKKRQLRREFVNNPHRIKCRIRAGNAFDVEIDHLSHAYNELSGKKIDGFIINDLIDRYGFSDGEQASRKDLSAKYGISSHAVEVAENKLKNIVRKRNVLREYKKYLETFTAEAEHDIKRDSYNV